MDVHDNEDSEKVEDEDQGGHGDDDSIILIKEVTDVVGLCYSNV